MNVHLLPIAFLPSCPPPIRSSSWEEVRGLIWAHPWIVKAALIEVVQWYTPGCWLLSSWYRQGIWATHQQQSYFYVHSHRVADFDRKSNCSILNHFYNIITNREALAAGFPRWLVGWLPWPKRTTATATTASKGDDKRFGDHMVSGGDHKLEWLTESILTIARPSEVSNSININICVIRARTVLSRNTCSYYDQTTELASAAR